MMKVKGGLGAITQNPAAMTKLFLIAPGLTKLFEQAQHMTTHTDRLSRSLFAPDGSLLPSTAKSKLMSILENLPQNENQDGDHMDLSDENSSNRDQVRQAIIIDGMAVVYELSNKNIKSISELADQFLRSVHRKIKAYNIAHIVFDRYDIENSLKAATRIRRGGGMVCCTVHDIKDSTNINVSMKTFLCNSENKDKLNVYHGEKCLRHLSQFDKTLVMATKEGATSNDI